MSRNKNTPKPPRQGHTGLNVFLTILILVMILSIAGMIYLCIGVADRYMDELPAAPAPTQPAPADPGETTAPAPTETEPPETTLPEPEHAVGTVTVTSTGDLLMHTPLYQQQYNSAC